jgi:hypothetical protein
MAHVMNEYDTSTEQNVTHFEMSSFQNVTKQKVLGRLNSKICLKEIVKGDLDRV